MGESNKLIRLDPNKLASLELDNFAPYPSETVLSGISEHERWQFDHDELFVGAYQAKPAKLALKDYPYDEFMYLLSGKIDITDKDGNLQSFFQGEHPAPCLSDFTKVDRLTLYFVVFYRGGGHRSRTNHCIFKTDFLIRNIFPL